MLTHALLAATLLTPLSFQPPSTPQPQQQPVEQPRLDQLLTARLKAELTQPLADVGWSAEDQAFFAAKILPSLFRPALKVSLTPEDEARFDRLKPRRAFNEQFGKDAPIRDDELVISWVKTARNFATLRGAAPKNFYRPYGTVKDLKPGLLRLWLSTRTGSDVSRDSFAKLIADDLAQALADPGLAGERARMVAYVLSGASTETGESDTLLRAAELYAARPDADKWFADYCTGLVEIELAWRERGAALAAQTTAAQFRGFYAHLAKAETALTRAHAARPSWTEPAQAMITVAMGQGNSAKYAPLYWYQQAMKADPADPRAATAALTYAAEEKWAGKAGKAWIDQMIADAAASRDFTSTMPLLSVTMLLDRAAETKRQQGADEAIQAPGVYERLRAVFTGYVNAKDPAITPDAARTWLLFLARSADKPAEALALLDTPGFTPVDLACPIARSPFAIRCWAALADSPHRDAIAAADKTLLRGKTDDALRAYQDIAAKAPAGEAASLVRSRIEMITRVRQAGAEGKAIQPLLLENAGPGVTQTALCVPVLSYGWGSRIEPVTSPQGPSAAICIVRPRDSSAQTSVVLPAPLDVFKQGYELTFDAHIAAAHRSQPPALLIRPNHGAPQSGFDVAGPSVLLNADGARFSKAHSENPALLKHSATAAHHRVRILITGWKAEVWCNDALADWCAGPSPFDRDNAPGGWLTFASETSGHGDIRIENLTIAPLKEPLTDRPKRDRNPSPARTPKPQKSPSTPAKNAE